jgi:hypothetical protein
MTHPWERRPGESSKAHQAFALYRDLGPGRCLDEASRRYHGQRGADHTAPAARAPRASGQIRRWARRWDWAARAAAWDHELQRRQQAEQVAAVRDMAERHAREAVLLQNKAVERLRQLRPEELNPRETLAFLVEAAKLERLARGEPTERVAEEHHFSDVTELSDDELARIVAGRTGAVPVGRPGTLPASPGPQEPL